MRDIIDLEYFFHKDAVSQSGEDQHYLNDRDRNIFLDSFASGLKEGETPGRKTLIRAWLDRQRQEEAAGDAVLPGEGFESLYSSFRLFFLLVGIVFGGGAGLTFMTYTGDRPLNVFAYLSVFVFSQVLILLLLLVLSLYRIQKGAFLSSCPLYRLIGRSMLKSVLWIRKSIAAKLGAERRSRTEATLGLIMGKGRTYGLLFILPSFILAQLFAMGFNLGVLGTTLFKVITADIAFGWQSTLQLSPETVHTLVQKIALPWSWLKIIEPAYPSLTQIEGSRIILKEGIYHLSTQDLASWWPFLCCSVLFYGLLPRLLLFLTAVAVQGRYLASLDFKQGAYEQLLLRMTTPLVSTRGRRVNAEAGAAGEPEAAGAESHQPTARSSAMHILVMIPEDIGNTVPGETISAALQERLGTVVSQIIRINKNYETDAEILSDLKNSSRPEDTDILLIQEAWQPPIAEYVSFIKNLRQALGPRPCIRIGLIGKPSPETIFTPVKDENRRIWARKITALGDPCIYTMGLVNNAP